MQFVPVEVAVNLFCVELTRLMRAFARLGPTVSIFGIVLRGSLTEPFRIWDDSQADWGFSLLGLQPWTHPYFDTAYLVIDALNST